FLEMGYSTYRFGDNGSIPYLGGPKRMLAPFWDDLDPAEAGDIYQYYDDIEHRWIFEFYGVDHYGGPGHYETFQVILLDPQYYPTLTGDGEILYLYSHVANATSNTVGIEDDTEQRGLQYLCNNTYDANAAPLVSNRALLITTKPPAGTYNTPWLYIIDYTINDSAGGNNNGIVEPDETIDIYISIKNNGDTSAYNVTGILKCNDNDAEVIDSISSFGDIAAGATANNINDAYTVHISDNPADSTIGFSLQLECNGGTYNKTDYFTIYIYGLPGIEEQELLGYDQSFGLQIYPNPFRKITDIRCKMQDARYTKQDISLKIYDVSGRLIRSFNLASCLLLPASTVSWDATDDNGRQVASGIYFISLDIDDYKQINKVVLLK
ncbi:T9SS type A sorting domain-containing protein, partial [candidate division WOR-3 bacterium]|nr:T9SS type A sorting domain-containing protein [candidate division WOR-3 bacterium]